MSDDSRLFLEKIEGRLGEKCRQHHAPLSIRNNSKLRKKFIWEASAVKKVYSRFNVGTMMKELKELRERNRDSNIKRYRLQREIYGKSKAKFGNIILR